MWWTGTALNALTVLAGGLLGTTIGARLPLRLRENVVRGVGLFTLVMGAKFALETANLLYLLGAILLGGVLGSLARLEERLAAAGDALERRLARRAGTAVSSASADAAPAIAPSGSVSQGFVTAAIVFCVGPLTFLGSIQNGLSGDATLLVIKSVLDGFTAIALAATFGWGVLLSVVVILLYQGGLAAGATLFAGLLSQPQLREMSAVGGLLILGVGLRLLRMRDVGVADYLPAIIVAPVLVAVARSLAIAP